MYVLLTVYASLCACEQINLLCNNQHKSDVVEIEMGQINDVLLQSGLLITQPLWEAH